MIVEIQGEKTAQMLRKNMKYEFDLHERLTRKGCRHIVDVYGVSYRRRHSPPMLGYVYMEYAPFGDLRRLLEKHDARNEKYVVYLSLARLNACNCMIRPIADDSLVLYRSLSPCFGISFGAQRKLCFSCRLAVPLTKINPKNQTQFSKLRKKIQDHGRQLSTLILST